MKAQMRVADVKAMAMPILRIIMAMFIPAPRESAAAEDGPLQAGRR